MSFSAAMRDKEAQEILIDLEHVSTKTADNGVWPDMKGCVMTTITRSIAGEVHTCMTGPQLVHSNKRSESRPSFAPLPKHTPCFGRSG